MREWWHERRGHVVRWQFHAPFWTIGDPQHLVCSCGKEWWA